METEEDEDRFALLPLEVSVFIVSLLGPRDLAAVLGVNRAWRNIANMEHLWKRHCASVRIFSVPDRGGIEDSSDLNDWAWAYADYAGRALSNWKMNKCIKSEQTRPRDCVLHVQVSVEANLMTVVFTSGAVEVFSLDGSLNWDLRDDLPPGLEPTSAMPTHLPQRCIVLSKSNLACHFHVEEDLVLTQVLSLGHGNVTLKSGEVPVSEFIRETYMRSCSLEVKQVVGVVAWIYNHTNNFIYLWDLKSYEASVVVFDDEIEFIELGGNSVYLVQGQLLMQYSPTGQKLSEVDLGSEIYSLCCGTDVVAAKLRDEIAVWRNHSRVFRTPTTRYSTMAFSLSGEVLFHGSRKELIAWKYYQDQDEGEDSERKGVMWVSDCPQHLLPRASFLKISLIAVLLDTLVVCIPSLGGEKGQFSLVKFSTGEVVRQINLRLARIWFINESIMVTSKVEMGRARICIHNFSQNK